MPKPIDVREFWQRSREALDELNDVMQIFATNLAQLERLELPPHTVKDGKRALAKFRQNFSRMIREAAAAAKAGR
jgi:sugar-specific transcriptional regulator TrmB